jgi:hypothetical protein
MVSPRNSTVRGSRTPGRSGSGAPDPAEFTPEVVADPEAPRNVVSYVLARRAALEHLRRRGAFDTDNCDASPNLLRAAKYHGQATGRPCPVCHRAELVEVFWVYGAQLGPLAGSARSSRQLLEMSHEHGRFRVYVVEVCQTCAWNFLNTSYNLGDGRPRMIGRARADAVRSGSHDADPPRDPNRQR